MSGSPTPITKPILIVFSGLPGTGKSRLAEDIARFFGIPVFAKDWIEASLRQSLLSQGIDPGSASGYAGYDLLTSLADRQLRMGQSTILDSVAAFERIRSQWRELAERYQAGWRAIECICSDENLQRARLEQRQRGIPGWHELNWADIEHVRSYYEAWQSERLIVDMVNPYDHNLKATIEYLTNNIL
jgi:predicted kinase